MDALERLTVDMIQSRTLESLDHIQRYELAGALVHGKHVIDLGCGVGYGSAHLGRTAATVVGVDSSTDAIGEASVHYAADNVEFVVSDGFAYLDEHRVDDAAIVAFEFLEHIENLEQLIPLLASRATHGDLIVLSVPNNGFHAQENEFHQTDFTLQSAKALFDRIGPHRLVAQYLAEGTMIAGAEVDKFANHTSWVGEGDAEAASHFIAVFNGDASDVLAGELQMIARPQVSRYINELETANRALYQSNAAIWAELQAVTANPEHHGSFASAAAARAAGKRDVNELRAEVDELNATIEAMQESFSWTITMPLRAFKRSIKSR